MRISVAGTGYVGLVSGVCLAERGHEVICVDRDQAKVDKITNCQSPIYEKNLDELITNNVNVRMSATTDLGTAIHSSDVTFIAVGTPFDGTAIDTSFVEEVAAAIGHALSEKESYHVVVVKSTVVPGTTDDLVLPILEKYSGKVAGADFGVGMNPEFLREGDAIEDFMNPDRIVLGGMDDRTRNVLQEVYSSFPDADIVLTNNKTAEMIKYAANSLLATLISYSNEIANLCSMLQQVDATEVMRGVHLDKRFTPMLDSGERVVPLSTTYLEGGCGFGGSCFPKDVKALISYGKELGLPMHLLDAVIRVNKTQPEKVIELLKKHYPVLAGVRVAVLGLAFKPGTDDMRESPAIPIVRQLTQLGAEVHAFDPIALDEARKVLGEEQIRYVTNIDDAIEESDAILLLTKWDHFTNLPDKLKLMDTPPVLVDGRRFIDKDDVERYEGIGLSA